MSMRVRTARSVRGTGRHCKRILKVNGDMKIGGVAIGWGDDVNQQDRAIDIMRGLLLWKRHKARFMVLTEQEGPSCVLFEYNNMLTIVEMASPEPTVYEDIMPMKVFASRFVWDLRQYCKMRVSLPDNLDRKNGKRIVKRLVGLLMEWDGKPIRENKPRRGASRQRNPLQSGRSRKPPQSSVAKRKEKL